MNFSPNNGDSAIITYNLQWDRGTNGVTWYNLIGSSTDSLTTSYIVTNGVVAGNFFMFRVRAKNQWGWGSFSPSFTIQASTMPDKVSVPTTSIVAETGAVLVQWQKPNERSNEIDMYKIEIQSSSDSSIWSESLASCDGKLPSVVLSRQCIIPMETLLAAPFTYQLSQVIKVRVTAHN